MAISSRSTAPSRRKNPLAASRKPPPPRPYPQAPTLPSHLRPRSASRGGRPMTHSRSPAPCAPASGASAPRAPAPCASPASRASAPHASAPCGPRLRTFALALAITAFAGCAVGPNYHTPDEHPPADFAAAHGQHDMTAKPTSQAAQAPTVDFSTWWHSLNDPELDSLVSRAITGNPDVQIALDHLQAARTYE